MTEKKGERIAKVIARAGLCSRRDAEKLIAEGRVLLDGKKLDTAAVTVGPANIIRVDGKVLPKPEPPRLYRYNKPRGRVTTSRDPEGRPTIYDDLPKGLPRLQPVGRLDLNSEGLLLLTNDGGLKRQLELPSSALVRRYRVRVYGQVDEERLAGLKKGTVIDGFSYGPIEAEIERRTGTNTWLIMALQEGKNREIRQVCRYLGLQVNRLIRLSYGPLELGDLPTGEVRSVPSSQLKTIFGEERDARTRKGFAKSKTKPRKSGGRKSGRPKQGGDGVLETSAKPRPKTTGKPGTKRSGKGAAHAGRRRTS